MSYGPLSHCRHSAGDRSTKVGHGNNLHYYTECVIALKANCVKLELNFLQQKCNQKPTFFAMIYAGICRV